MTADLGPRQVLFRVDPRLVHATLMNAWVPATQATWLLVVDATVYRDARRRHIYEMSSDGAEVTFCPPAEAQAALEGLSGGSGIVLFSTLSEVIRSMRGGLEIPVLNVGHVPAGEGRNEVHPAVHLGPADNEMLRQIVGTGCDVLIQPRPDDSPFRPNLPSPRGAPSPAAPLPAVATATRSMAAPAEPDDPDATRLEVELEVVNERGLHLRAAHVLAALANQLPTSVEVGRPGDMVNAKSLLGLTTLGAARGTRLTVVVEGDGASDAMAKIRALFAGGFDEGVPG